MTRWTVLAIAGLLLVAATVWMWEHQWVRDAGDEAFVVRDQGGDRIPLEKSPADDSVVREVPLPFQRPVATVVIAFLHRAIDLVKGEEKWQEGRVLIRWRNREGEILASDVVMRFDGTDKKILKTVTAMECPVGTAFPELSIEHLGESGLLLVQDLEVSSVRRRTGLVPMTIGLVCFGMVWTVLVLRACSRSPLWRCVVAGAGLLAMIWCLVIPGPWADPRPLGDQFRLGGPVPEALVTGIRSPDTKKANSLESPGELPVKGSWLMRVKVALRFLRPFLHVLLFAVPAFGLAIVCGRSCAAMAMVAMTLLVELAQALFWFGVDWLDAADLVMDWGGIALALWGYGLLSQRFGEGRCLGLLFRRTSKSR